WTRLLHGASQYNPPSRFLDEIPASLVVDDEESRVPGRGRNGSGSGAGAGVSRIGSGRDAILERAMAPRGPVSTGAHQLGLEVGDDVVHQKWGEGVILDLRGEGDRAEATVRFPSVGEKQLLLSWAPLQKLER